MFGFTLVILDKYYYPGNMLPVKFESAASPKTFVAFSGITIIASGRLGEVALKVKEASNEKGVEPFLVFDNETSQLVDLDLRGTRNQILKRFEEVQPDIPPVPDGRGPGRPKLGVVGREVTLLPRHWEWLNEQPGGPSVTIRKLVEEAKRTSQAKDRVRRAKEAAYRFMNVMAGNLPGFEEATRIVFGTGENRLKSLEGLTKRWPADIRAHALHLMQAVDAAEAADRAGG
jgi:hypothetical protein